ncbi:MAG: hypothetical protein U1F77_09565 [Kiritimatiellia bacterium]
MGVVPVAVTVGRRGAHHAGAPGGGAGDGGGRVMTMEKAWVASGRVPLAAVMVPVKVPVVVGVPEITPPGLMESPSGRPGAEKVMGVVPVAVTVWS